MFFNGPIFLTEGFFTHIRGVFHCESQKLNRHEATTAIQPQ